MLIISSWLNIFSIFVNFTIERLSFYFFCLDFQLEEKERLLHNLILQNSQTADMCDAKLPAEIYKGVCNMQVLQGKQENKVKVNTHYPYVSFVVHISYCWTDFLFLF